MMNVANAWRRSKFFHLYPSSKPTRIRFWKSARFFAIFGGIRRAPKHQAPSPREAPNLKLRTKARAMWSSSKAR